MGLKEQDIVFTTTDESGNKVLQMPITRYENVEGILDFVYPVGSLYWSKNAADPSTLFGGTWERVKDTFILAAGDSYKAGSTGGEASHTLTTNEMPSHGHTGSTSSEGVPDHIHAIGYNNSNNWGTWVATNATGTYLSDVTLDEKASYSRAWNGSGGTNALTSIGTNKDAYDANIATSKSIAATGGGTTGDHSHTLTIASAGGGAAHNNMPPYATYYCWERTA
ncbi:phage baseplate protein [Phascolarctobacterium sp.]|uniref:phage baseplate protein n=1 Tax=Phascolarctobacterium sp. TaxID=2049039 RepID=UPI003867C4CB